MSFFDQIDAKVAPVAAHLKHRAARHSAIAANIANVDTPGYKAVEVSFKEAMDSAGLKMARTHAGHLGSGSGSGPAIDVVELGGPQRRDGNNVNIDHEMVKLAENQIEYRYLAERIKGMFDKLKSAIAGRPTA